MAEIQANNDAILTPSDLLLNRWYVEQERLRFFHAFKLIGIGDKVIAAEGTVKTHSGNTYGIRITLDNFPHSLPKVFPEGWTVHPHCPHTYNDGSLCIMRSAQWRNNFTIKLVIMKTSLWLGKYEIWKRNGHVWPGVQQRH